jgi:hypothetical protein
MRIEFIEREMENKTITVCSHQDPYDEENDLGSHGLMDMLPPVYLLMLQPSRGYGLH